MIIGRSLHFVFKVGDRKATSKFYREVLGMKVLRHEEFMEGCEADCNGPYNGRWSKTMVGYGPEDTHFAIELTYNYDVKHYKRGNDFVGITIKSREALERAKNLKWPIKVENGVSVLESPDGYKFFILDDREPTNSDPIQKVALNCSSLSHCLEYYRGLLGLKLYKEERSLIVLGYATHEAKIEFHAIGGRILHEEAYGRIAFSCSQETQQLINQNILKANMTVLTPLISLDTPGKATVQVLILADPDGHEICFVDDPAFRSLSAVEENATMLLDRYIRKDVK